MLQQRRRRSRTGKIEKQKKKDVVMIPGVSKDPIGCICCGVNTPSNNTDLMINIVSARIIFKNTRSGEINKRLGNGYTTSDWPIPNFSILNLNLDLLSLEECKEHFVARMARDDSDGDGVIAVVDNYPRW